MNCKEIYDKRFITKVKKRGKLRQFVEWITIGTIALGIVHNWSWDGKVIKRETNYIERNIEKTTSNIVKIAPVMMGSILVFFTNPGTIVWPVPNAWDNFANSIECIGAGGGGGPGPGTGGYGGGGGGGGAYAKSTNFSIYKDFLYVTVGKGGVGDGYTDGGKSWVCTLGSAEPININEGVLAVGGSTGQGWSVSSAIGGAGGAAISCVGLSSFSGGTGGTTTGEHIGGGGGGAAGLNGAGGDAVSVHSGGKGDNNFGGIGGTVPSGQAWGNKGNNGTEWTATLGSQIAIVGSGGGGSGAYSTAFVAQGGGNGGLYGGGGGGGSGGLGGGGSGGDGLVVISYIPELPVCLNPKLPPVTPPSYGPGSSSGGGAIAGVSPGTQAQFYWTYGTWIDQFGPTSSAHYDKNYNKLLTLTGDDNSANFDDNYGSGTNWSFKNESENEFSDVPRVWKSRSNEWLQDGGARSVWCRHRCSIANNVNVPDIDPPASYITTTTNLLFTDEQTFGYRLSYTENTGYFLGGDTIVQEMGDGSYSYGTVYQMDPNFIYLYICAGAFVPNLPVYNLNIPTINTYITASTEMNEKFPVNVFPGQSRYICKSVILATGQDAEDLQVYIGAYRPANTNFKIYGKVKSAQDTSGLYVDRIWSRMAESNTSSALFSSSINLQNYVELMYDFPVSQLIYANTDGCGVTDNSIFVSMPSTNIFSSGNYIYLTDPFVGAFNIRLVSSVVNSTTLQLTSTPSFSNTTNANIGIISGLEDPTGAFLYDQNNNIMRYVTPDDIAFDSFNQFAIKIVPISDNPVIVPRASDVRCLALQV